MFGRDASQTISCALVVYIILEGLRRWGISLYFALFLRWVGDEIIENSVLRCTFAPEN